MKQFKYVLKTAKSENTIDLPILLNTGTQFELDGKTMQVERIKKYPHDRPTVYCVEHSDRAHLTEVLDKATEAITFNYSLPC